jgi:hypothetical protein
VGSGSPADETRAAIRLVGWVTVAALLLVGLVTAWLSPQRELVRTADLIEPKRALAQVQALDRSVHGDRPVVWVVGSSVARQAFDLDTLRTGLSPDWGVEKIAFNRGAPVFAAGLVQQLDVRAGDRVVLQLAEDHFQSDWLSDKGADELLQLLVPPRHLAALPLPLPQRLEALAARPHRLYAWRREAAEGLSAWLSFHTFGGRRPKPRDLLIRVRRVEERDHYEVPDGPLDQGWAFDGSPEQINRHAVDWLRTWLHARDAELWGVGVPFRPEIYGTRISADTRRRFEQLAPTLVDHWVELPQLPGDAYSDHRHPNLIGQPVLTEALQSALRSAEP